MTCARMLSFIACGLGFNSTTFLFSFVFSVPEIGLSALHTAAKAKSLSRVQCDFYYLNFSYSFYVIFFLSIGWEENISMCVRLILLVLLAVCVHLKPSFQAGGVVK